MHCTAIITQWPSIPPQLNQFKNKGVAYCCWRCTIMLAYHAYVLHNVPELSIWSKGIRVNLNRKEEKLTSMDDNENECKCKAADACTLSMCSACAIPTSICRVHSVYVQVIFHALGTLGPGV